jgi:hypothetical protein
VALALFSACGGGGGGTAAATHPPEATGSETSGAPAISKEKAEALSSSMLLRLTDFPAGWRAEPTDEQDSCAGIDRVTERYHVLGKAQSKTFAKGDSTEATSEAGLFRDKPTAREAMNYLEASIQSKRFRQGQYWPGVLSTHGRTLVGLGDRDPCRG